MASSLLSQRSPPLWAMYAPSNESARKALQPRTHRGASTRTRTAPRQEERRKHQRTSSSADLATRAASAGRGGDSSPQSARRQPTLTAGGLSPLTSRRFLLASRARPAGRAVWGRARSARHRSGRRGRRQGRKAASGRVRVPSPTPALRPWLVSLERARMALRGKRGKPRPISCRVSLICLGQT